MERICAAKLEEAARLLDFGLFDEGIEEFGVLGACAASSDCADRGGCQRRVLSAWSGVRQRAESRRQRGIS